MNARIAVFGKHPAFGDFVAHGLPQSMREDLQTWMTKTLGAVKEQAGEGWPEVYDAARPVRFWLGATLLGDTLCGVLQVSRDKVGRRYPLIALMRAETAMPPPLAPDQSAFQTMEAHLARVLESGAVTQPSELGAGDGLDTAEPGETDALWAVNPDAEPADLLQAVGSADYTRSAGSRSYWWCAPDDIRSGAVWSCDGLAGPDALLWLFMGVARGSQSGQDEEEVAQMRTTTGDKET